MYCRQYEPSFRVGFDVRYYLNSYRPLAMTAHGVAASAKHRIPPFVDGSIRREPDLEHRFPSITCVCRGDLFAPRLEPGDVVGYMTVKHRFGDREKSHRRLTAILQVVQTFNTHVAAAEWYQNQGLKLPSNCLVPGNPPLDLEFSHRDACDPKFRNVLDPETQWDAKYWARTSSNGAFVVCEPLFVELGWLAPMVHDQDLVDAFGRVPPSRNPGELPPLEFIQLLRILRIAVPLFAQ